MTDVADPQPLVFDPLQAGYAEDPFPHLAEMRRRDPVHRSIIERWVLFRYDDVARLLRDPSLSVSEANIEVVDEHRLETFREAYGGELERSTSMLGADPPDHTRLRRLVSKAFTPTAIEALRPRITRMVDDVLDAMEEQGSAEVVGELAFPLPFDVISEMLGMPATDTARVAEWSSALVKTLDPIITDDEIRASVVADREMRGLVEEVIAWKRAHPADDLLSALIAAEEDGDRLTTRELRDQVVLLFVAGHETTVNLIGTGIHELLRHPDQAAVLRDDPSCDVDAVDELLRYVSPVQFSRRIALQEIEIGGRTIEPGVIVMACLAAANHDPERWGPTAEQLDVRRPGANQHLAFGSGIHYCLGAALAKLEAQLAIGRFVRRFPDAAPAAEPVWNGRINLRGIERLEVGLR